MDAWTDLTERVRLSWLRDRPARVAAAVSGGADSVALLLVLAELSRQEGFSLSAVHVDHGLRPESAEDAAFVRALCEGQGVLCRVLTVHLAGKSEDEARQARYDAILSSLTDCPDFHLALAHHQRDQAETLLLHLFRGSGGEGLSGMAERSCRSRPGGAVVLWRPMLSVSPDQIRQALTERGIPWREDASNARDDYLRNYLRNRVLPAVRERIPEAEAAMGRAAITFAGEADFFRREARRFLNENQNACLYDPFRHVKYAPFAALHPALRRHVIRQASPVPLNWEQTEALCAIQPGETVNLPNGWQAQCTDQALHFLSPEGMAHPDAPLMDHACCVPDSYAGDPGDGKRTQAMPRKIYAQCGPLRAWRTGDRIHPLGASGSKSMQDYFVDKKVPRPFRPYIPLLCIGQRVIWAVGVGPSEEARVRPGDDAVLVRYEGFLPGDVPANQDTEGE